MTAPVTKCRYVVLNCVACNARLTARPEEPVVGAFISDHDGVWIYPSVVTPTQRQPIE